MNRMAKFSSSVVLLALVSLSTPVSAGINQTLINGTKKVKVLFDGSKKVLNSLAKPLIYASNHKALTAATALSATALYLTCIADTQEWPVIKESQAVTEFMRDSTGMPAGKLQYWKISKWETAGDIIANKIDVYKDFKLEKMNGDRNEIAFIDRVNNEIDGEKGKLNTLLKSLSTCLAQCKIRPDIALNKQKEFDWVTQLIKKEKKRFGIIPEMENEAPLLHKLSAGQIKAIGHEVRKATYLSFLKPHCLVRHFIFPNELPAIQEVWKIRQLIARLDALQACLTEKKISINQLQMNPII